MKARPFLDVLVEQQLGPFTGVPCSLVKELIELVEDSPEISYYTATSEGEAMGIAAGLSLAGKIPVVIMQNDGLGNAINPLSSLQLLYQLPVLLIITWRAEPGGQPDAIQHRIMGEILLDLLRLLKIPFRILEDDFEKVKQDVLAACRYMKDHMRPYAFIVRRGFFAPQDHLIKGSEKGLDGRLKPRIEYLRIFGAHIHPEDLILATTGYTGRELMQEVPRTGNFYMAGSMGCVTSIGLGVALEHPKRKVYILDGDGALLMKMGTLATIGYYKPKNLVHLLFDNGAYESTGCQKTVSEIVRFPSLALHSGYAYAESVTTPEGFLNFFLVTRQKQGPLMCHIRVQSGTVKNLRRPESPPIEHRDDFMDCLRNSKGNIQSSEATRRL